MLILHHANVITLDPAVPRAELVAVKGETVSAVGSNDLIPTLDRPGAELIDCEGKTVVPGFNDAHCHVLAFARSLLSVDCSPFSARSITEIKAKIAERAAKTPAGAWIDCSWYNEFHLSEKRHPTRRDLDEAAPQHPVKLSHFSGHMCVLKAQA